MAGTTGKDVLLQPDGRVYHLGVKEGEINNRILTVGKRCRAESLGELLDKNSPITTFTSDRLMTTVNGKFKGVDVSIVCIGMGAPMADFLVRESSFLIPGPMALIRLGTCGILAKDVLPGTVCVADQTSYVYTNYAFFDGCVNDPKQDGRNSGAKPYLITKPIDGDKKLNELLKNALKTQGLNIIGGVTISGETFYSCQGRKDSRFLDENQTLMDDCLKLGATAMEMETHQFFHSAIRRKSPMLVAGLAIGIVNRTTDSIKENITAEKLKEDETKTGLAALTALSQIALPKQ